MILDNFLMFTGSSNGASAGIVASSIYDAPTTGTQVASNIIDLGLSGIPTSANGGGARDIGVGDPELYLSALVDTAFTGGTSLQLELSGAPDNGSGAPGSYTVMWTGPAVAEASLVAGMQIANISVPRPVPGQVMPRYLRLRFITVGTHSTGNISCCIVLNRDDMPMGITGLYSGYPAGLTVAN